MSLADRFADAIPHAQSKPNPRRQKVFGEGPAIPLDRNVKARIMFLARALRHPTEPRKHYGKLHPKFLEVLDALLFGFHNCHSGRCFPGYEKIAERAHCDPKTVSAAIQALESAGILTWVHRHVLRRVPIGRDLLGGVATRWRAFRTSNAYTFTDPKPPPQRPNSSKGKFSTRTIVQDSFLDMDDPLHRALARLEGNIKGKDGADAPESGFSG